MDMFGQEEKFEYNWGSFALIAGETLNRVIDYEDQHLHETKLKSHFSINLIFFSYLDDSVNFGDLF